jgi:hypothetical protein
MSFYVRYKWAGQITESSRFQRRQDAEKRRQQIQDLGGLNPQIMELNAAPDIFVHCGEIPQCVNAKCPGCGKLLTQIDANKAADPLVPPRPQFSASFRRMQIQSLAGLSPHQFDEDVIALIGAIATSQFIVCDEGPFLDYMRKVTDPNDPFSVWQYIIVSEHINPRSS